MQKPAASRKIAFLADYLPRKRGIATFTTDLRCAVATEFPAMQCLVVPVNDRAGGYAYPAEVRFEIAEQDLPSYLRAAREEDEDWEEDEEAIDADRACVRQVAEAGGRRVSATVSAAT